jgi:hypothetical protein
MTTTDDGGFFGALGRVFGIQTRTPEVPADPKPKKLPPGAQSVVRPAEIPILLVVPLSGSLHLVAWCVLAISSLIISFLEVQVIAHQTYEIVKPLQSGGFAQVFEVRYNHV